MEEIDEERKEASISLFKEGYKESYFFEELSSVEPMDWVNIPKPIQQVVQAIKKCLGSNNKQLTDINDKLHQITSRYKKRLDNFDEKVNRFETQYKENIEKSESVIMEVKQGLSDEMNGFQEKINKDLGFKFKTIEGKLAYNDDQVFNLKKFVNSLPGVEEVEKIFKIRGGELKESIKDEINNFYIQPLEFTVKSELGDLNEKIKSVGDLIEVMKNDYLSKNKESQEKCEENSRKMKNLIEKLKDYINVQVKSTENNFDEKIEKSLRNIEGLNTSLHEINLKYQSKIFDIQKEINASSVKATEFFKSFETLKKQIEEEKIAEKITEESQSDYEQGNQGNFKIEEKIPVVKNLEDDVLPVKVVNKPESVQKNRIETKPEAIVKNEVRPSQRKKSVFSKTPQEDISKQLTSLSKYVDTKFSLLDERLSKEITETILPLEKRMKEVIYKNESDFSDIREKLAWLPMSFASIKDKSPTEARIFTLEARLRAEENIRNESVSRLIKMIDKIHSLSPSLHEDGSLPPIRTISVVHERHLSQDSGISSDSIRKQAESELSRFSNAFKPGKSNFLKNFSLKNQFNSTVRENSFLARK